MNNNEMVSVPRALSESIIRMLQAGGAWDTAQRLRNHLAKPAEQHQGAPIMLTAVAELVDDGDGGLEARWLLEGGTAELFTGMTLLVAENAPDLCQEDGSAQVYTHADTGEAERLRDALESACNLAHARTVERDTLRAELVDATQSLKTISELAGRDEFMQDIADVRAYAKSRSSAANHILSVSAEPSAPVERLDRQQVREVQL